MQIIGDETLSTDEIPRNYFAEHNLSWVSHQPATFFHCRKEGEFNLSCGFVFRCEFVLCTTCQNEPSDRPDLFCEFAAFEKGAKQFWSRLWLRPNGTFGLTPPQWMPPPPPAINQVRTKVNFPSTDIPLPLTCHPLLMCQTPHWRTPSDMTASPADMPPPPCSAWRWRQPSTLAFGAKSLVHRQLLFCSQECTHQ